MKISFISSAILPSTAAHAVQTFSMAAALGGQGAQVTLLAPWHRGRIRGRRQEARLFTDFALDPASFSLRYIAYPHLGERLRASYFAVACAAARLSGCDLVYTRNLRIAVAAARAHCRVILESHGPPRSPKMVRAARWLCRQERVLRWVFISERLQALFDADYALPSHRCVVAHDGVDLRRFSPQVAKSDARRRLGIAEDTRLVVHSGHLYPGRGIELLVEVASQLPDIDFLFVGGTPQDIVRHRRQVRVLRLTNVRFSGHRPVSEVGTYLFAADVLLMPYTAETLTSDGKTASIDYASPMKLFEYMAAGRAIVATRFPGISEVLHSDTNSVLVEPGRVDSLRDGIQGVLANPTLAKRLGSRARSDVEHYTWQRRAASVLSGI